MKKFDQSAIDFILDTPSCQEISKIIDNMSSSASPCPFNQVSIIAFKNCPIVRSHFCRNIQKAWIQKSFPTTLKREVTIFAYKKGSNEKPENFQPITLQPLLSKVFTTVIGNRLYNFVYSNKYIELHIQKGFWEDVSGCIEHTGT